MNFFSVVMLRTELSALFEMQRVTPFDSEQAVVGQACIRSDPFVNPGRRSMFEMAMKARGPCGPTGVHIVTPSLPLDPRSPANNPNLLGIGERANFADYAFGSALETHFCGNTKCGAPDCQNCQCASLRNPCFFKNGFRAEQPGCQRLWFTRNNGAWTSPQDGNINANIRWG